MIFEITLGTFRMKKAASRHVTTLKRMSSSPLVLWSRLTQETE